MKCGSVVVGALLLAAPMCLHAQTLSSADRAEILQFRQELAEQMAAPQSPLGMVVLQQIQTGDTGIGSATGSKVHFERTPPELGRVRLQGDRVQFLAPPPGFPSGLTIGGRPASAGDVSFDRDGTSPVFQLGSVNFVLRHKFGYWIVGRDTQTHDLVGFHGLRWYAPDARYRIVAQWKPWPQPRVLRVANILGQVNEETSFGVAEFTRNGRTYRLEPSVIAGRAKPLFFVFRDTTSRTTTYGAGRFLDASMPSNGVSKAGTVLLDFNEARNPWCAFSSHTSCPLPPLQNRLNVAIPAGEQLYFTNGRQPQ